MDALAWLKAWFSDTLPSKVVQMLHNVPISAAPTERNLSLRNGIYNKLRNRINVDTESKNAFIKHNLLLEYAHLFKIATSDQAMDESHTDEQVYEEEKPYEDEEDFESSINAD